MMNILESVCIDVIYLLQYFVSENSIKPYIKTITDQASYCQRTRVSEEQIDLRTSG